MFPDSAYELFYFTKAGFTGTRDSPQHRHVELCVLGRATMKEVLRPSSSKEGLRPLNKEFLPECSHLPE